MDIRPALHRLLRSTCLAAAPLCLALLTACSNEPGKSQIVVEPSEYPATFQAAKHVLRDFRFDLNRVDAPNGVITTEPKETAGFGTPWDKEQTNVGQEAEDLVQHQRRKVRITFEPTAPAHAAPGEPTPLPDLVADPQQVTMKVRVIMERLYRPHWQIDSTSIRLHSYAYDDQLAKEGLEPEYAVDFAEDPLLAGRLLQQITEERSRR